MKLVILGNSGSMSGSLSPASGYVLSSRDEQGQLWHLALEMGPGTFGRLQAFVDPAKLSAIALSHLHADHMVDLVGAYIYARWSPSSPLTKIPVLGPSATAERLAQVDGCGAEAAQYEPYFDFRTWQVGQAVELGPWTVEAFPALHPVEAYCVRITRRTQGDKAAQVFAFSGDSDTCPGLVEAARGADIFLCEAAFTEGETVRGIHLTGRRAAEVAREAGVRHLILTHLQPWADRQVITGEVEAVLGDGWRHMPTPLETELTGSNWLHPGEFILDQSQRTWRYALPNQSYSL